MTRTRIIISLLVALALAAAPLHALLAAGTAGGGIEQSVADAHAGHGGHAAAALGDCNGGPGDSGGELCLDCATCAPMVAAQIAAAHPVASAGPEYTSPLPKAREPSRQLRPPRSSLV